jgi:hypothetical protein
MLQQTGEGYLKTIRQYSPCILLFFPCKGILSFKGKEILGVLVQRYGKEISFSSQTTSHLLSPRYLGQDGYGLATRGV